MAIRNTPSPAFLALEQRLRAARPAVPPPSPQALTRLHARLREEAASHSAWDLALVATLSLGAAGTLVLWWWLDGPRAWLYAMLQRLSSGLSTLTCWGEHGLWPLALLAGFVVSAGFQLVLAGVTVRHYYRRTLRARTGHSA